MDAGLPSRRVSFGFPTQVLVTTNWADRQGVGGFFEPIVEYFFAYGAAGLIIDLSPGIELPLTMRFAGINVDKPSQLTKITMVDLIPRVDMSLFDVWNIPLLPPAKDPPNADYRYNRAEQSTKEKKKP